MDGVTTAILLFVFACVLFPRLIDSRPQYYAALGLTLVAIVLGPFAYSFGVRIALAVIQALAVVLLFLSAGGLTVRGLSTDMMGAFEVIRRGEKEKEIIIPRKDGSGGERKRKPAVETMGEPAERIDLTAEEGAGYPPKKLAPVEKRPKEDGPIPMD